ncbi:hypothetical protein [Arthrobacter sp. JSM 101049]|uniref:hypothetical protein n=1 Tax=Arthrobacter sp. JSM 101049 TaxID=929097 RepID=UPI003568BDEB
MTPAGTSARRRLPPTSYLRVFEPLRAYDDDAQLAIAAQRGVNRTAFEERAAIESLERTTRGITDPFPHDQAERYRELHYPGADGLTTPYYCPDQLPTRATLAAEQLDATMRPALLELLVPEAARGANAGRIRHESFAEDVASLHTRSATWGIPLGWFVLVNEDDHCEIEEDGNALLTVRLSAPAIQALERARFAAASLAIHAPELDILDELTSLGEWLSLFHEDSMIELDYGLVAEKVWPDESAQDLKLGIESLAEQDMLGAAAAYRRLTSRWLKVRQLARAN